LLRRLLLLFLLLPAWLYGGNVLTHAYVRGNQLVLKFAHPLDLRSVSSFHIGGHGSVRYIFDLKHMRMGSSRVPKGLRHPNVRSFRLAQYRPRTVRIVIEVPRAYTIAHRRSSSRVYTIALPTSIARAASSLGSLTHSIGNLFSGVGTHGRRHHETTTPIATHARPAVHVRPAALPKREQMPASQHHRYTVILDPGHGGKDVGAISGARREKDAVLQIAKRIRKHLQVKGLRVLMTRSADKFIPLRNRTRYANRQHGDVFVSIHANATGKKQKQYRHGIETFFLQTTRSDRAKRVAARENSVVLKRSDRMSKNVILNAVMTGPKIVLSNKLAIDVQRHILGNLRKQYKNVLDGGVRPAPFWVLVGAEMPAVLIETGYISNPMERKRLFSPRYQERLAKGVAEGIVGYLRNREKELQ